VPPSFEVSPEGEPASISTAMRRIAAVLLLLAAFVASPGCTGEDGERAQELLAQSHEALARVESLRFAGRFTVKTSAGDVTFVMRGASTSRDGGSSFVSVHADELAGFPEILVVSRRQEVWLNVGGAWQRTEAPAASSAGVGQFDFGPYVKDVRIADGDRVKGEAATKVTGVLDTAALVEGVLGGLGSVPGGALPDLSDSLGDTRVVLYLSDATRLPLRTLVDTSMDAHGEHLDIHIDFAVDGFGEPVTIPRPGS
jgi:hypothetical protein